MIQEDDQHGLESRCRRRSFRNYKAMLRIMIFLGVMGGVLCGQAWGWGCTGHEIVALVALNHLRADVKTNVEQLLGTQTHDYSGRYCSDLSLDPIAYYATWADDYRSAHPETGGWHFWDIPLSTTSATATQYCDQGCVVQALNDQLTILRDPSQDQQKRSMALMFVIHFVGDIHQPL